MDVKQIRLETRMNQTDFWAQYGVLQNVGSAYERGRNIPKPVRILIAIHRERVFDMDRYHRMAERIK